MFTANVWMHELWTEEIAADHNELRVNPAISVRYVGLRPKQTARGHRNITFLAEVSINFSQIPICNLQLQLCTLTWTKQTSFYLFQQMMMINWLYAGASLRTAKPFCLLLIRAVSQSSFACIFFFLYSFRVGECVCVCGYMCLANRQRGKNSGGN